MFRSALIAASLILFGVVAANAQSGSSPTAPAAKDAAPSSTSDTPKQPSVPLRPTREFNADGEISVEAVLKASVRNTADESLGDVRDVYLDKDGKISKVVVSVGGFLGMGDKSIAMAWSDLKMVRDGNRLILVTTFTKDNLNAAPAYAFDRAPPK